jgi:xylulokinase
MRILASVLRMPLTRYRGGDKGPAFGAARLARLAHTGESVETVCTPPPVLDVTGPDADLAEAYRDRLESFRRLYSALKPEFPALPAALRRPEGTVRRSHDDRRLR